MNLETVSEAMAAHGLIVRGGFHPVASDQVPVFAARQGGGTVVIVGNAGPAMWEQFSQSPERQLPEEALNTWTRRVIDATVAVLGAHALYPFDSPPYFPFQRWAQRAEPVWSSPIGILIHPEYGLWHGYRAALIFKESLRLASRVEMDSPCDSCKQRACLSTCPVGAFTGERYDVSACVGHISTPEGRECITLGCAARRACPIGVAYRYDSPQATFHQGAFLRSRTAREFES